MARYPCLLLAGDRGEGDRLSQAAKIPCRALLPLAGRVMIRGPLEALISSESIDGITISEPVRAEELKAELNDLADKVEWMPSASSPSSSVLAGLDRIEPPLLVTTADHAFLRSEIVDDFCRRAADHPADLVVGVVKHANVKKAFPEVKKTENRLGGEAWCGCNLFFFRTPISRNAAELWQRAEKDRKRPWRIARAIGWGFLAKFLSGRLNLDQALDHIGNKIGIEIGALELPFPEASIDVDSVEDWRIIEPIIKDRANSSAP